MTPADWAMLIATILGIASTLLMALRWLVKSFLYELKPNGGSSMKDKVNALSNTQYSAMTTRWISSE